jgi:hypothetical protein
MELIGPDNGASSRHLVKMVSLGACICAGVLVLIIIAQVISGAMLASASRQDYQASDDARRQAISNFSSLATTHSIFGQLALFPALFLVACSIVFGTHITSVGAKNTRYKWLPGALSILLTIVLIGIVCGGVRFAHFLAEHKYWLTPPAGGYPPDAEVAKEQLVTPASFSTFLATHGIVLPFLALILMIFLMPSFYEFVLEKKPKEVAGVKMKKLKLTQSKE